MDVTIEIGIPQNWREQARGVLFKALSNFYILMVKTQNYHWNIQGPYFQSYHKMLETQYEELAEGIDLLAERIRSLGFHVAANYRNFVAQAVLQEEMGDPTAEDMLKNLLHDQECLTREMRNAINSLKETEDEGTIDLFIERLRIHEKTAWILRAHVSDKT